MSSSRKVTIRLPSAPAVLLAMVLGAPALSGRAAPADRPIAVVISPGADAYQRALAGVRRELPRAPRVVEVTDGDGGAARAALAGAQAVIAIGPEALRVAEGLDPAIPVVSVLTPELATGAPPARQVYGIEPFAPPGEVLGVLAALAPAARALWTIHSDRTPPALLAQLRAAAAERGLHLVCTRAADRSDAARALRTPPDGVGAFLLLPDPVVRNEAFDEALLRLSFARRFPVVGTSRADVTAGALVALVLEPEALGAQAAAVVRRVLEPPAPPPPAMVPPDHLSLLVNAVAAERLGLPVPDALEHRAAEVVGR